VALVSPAELKGMESLRVYVLTRIELRHVRATAMAQSLRPFFVTSGASSFDIGTAGNDGVLLLQGLAADVAKAAEMVADADRPAPLPKSGRGSDRQPGGTRAGARGAPARADRNRGAEGDRHRGRQEEVSSQST